MTGVYNWAKRDPDGGDHRTYDITREGVWVGCVILTCDLPFHAAIVGAATLTAREVERAEGANRDRLRLVATAADEHQRAHESICPQGVSSPVPRMTAGKSQGCAPSAPQADTSTMNTNHTDVIQGAGSSYQPDPTPNRTPSKEERHGRT
jgi:hypothetical protein